MKQIKLFGLLKNPLYVNYCAIIWKINICDYDDNTMMFVSNNRAVFLKKLNLLCFLATILSGIGILVSSQPYLGPVLKDNAVNIQQGEPRGGKKGLGHCWPRTSPGPDSISLYTKAFNRMETSAKGPCPFLWRAEEL